LPEGVEHIYTSFPEGEIRKFEAIIGGKTKEKLRQELEEQKINVSGYAQEMIQSKYFTTQNNKEQITLVRLKVRDLGFTNGATTQEIYDKAKQLGLDLCPAEIGPNLRLQYIDQPLGEWFFVAMEQIRDRGGFPNVFNLERDGDGLWLFDIWANPGYRWNPVDEFAFCLRK
jgi:hypothetical protein